MGYQVSSLDALGEAYGFRKVRAALGVTAFGVTDRLPAAHYDGRTTTTTPRTSSNFVHRGTATFVVDGDEHTVGEGGLVHVESTTHRSISNRTDDELVSVIVGGKGRLRAARRPALGPEDVAKRQGLSV